MRVRNEPQTGSRRWFQWNWLDLDRCAVRTVLCILLFLSSFIHFSSLCTPLLPSPPPPSLPPPLSLSLPQASLKAMIGSKHVHTMVSTSDLAMTQGKASVWVELDGYYTVLMTPPLIMTMKDRYICISYKTSPRAECIYTCHNTRGGVIIDI